MLIFIAICAIILGAAWFLRAQNLGQFVMAMLLNFGGIAYLVL